MELWIILRLKYFSMTTRLTKWIFGALEFFCTRCCTKDPLIHKQPSEEVSMNKRESKTWNFRRRFLLKWKVSSKDFYNTSLKEGLLRVSYWVIPFSKKHNSKNPNNIIKIHLEMDKNLKMFLLNKTFQKRRNSLLSPKLTKWVSKNNKNQSR